MGLRCYVENLAGETELIELSEQEARHASAARRLSVGDALTVFDGCGRQAPASIHATTKRGVQIRRGIIEFRPRLRPALTIAVAMPKGPRQDLLVEKCTELAVAALQPLICERSVSGVSDHKLDKWRRTTIEAAKQSAQCWLPELRQPETLEAVLAEQRDSGAMLLAALLPRNGRASAVPEILGRIREAASIVAFVGPEGGWSDIESQMLLAAGAIPVSLGPSVLRIETAALALAAVVHTCMEPQAADDA